MSAGEIVNLVPGPLPADYHCSCQFCSAAIGELKREDGSYYSRLERRQYYDPSEKGEGGHIAKTPLHLARWAIQRYSKPGDWVLDPTIGAGTTAVEALTQGRNVAGMELEYADIVLANCRRGVEVFHSLHQAPEPPAYKIRRGDARNLGKFLVEAGVPRPALVVNNPPYSGDQSFPGPAKEGRGKEFRDLETTYFYDENLPNLAFLKEGAEYWDTMRSIYSAAVDHLLPGGHVVIGIKDMMRQKKPFLLHRLFCELLAGFADLEFTGTAVLKHYPGTLFLHTYHKLYGVHPPSYQTINVFRKKG